MGQRLLRVRVRPARVTVLISRDAQNSDLLLAFRFFGRLWGGRFGQILVVDPHSCDELNLERLNSSRPDFVYGIGLDDQPWASAVHDACQPRRYGALRPELVRVTNRLHPEDFLLVEHALADLYQERIQNKARHQNLRLVTPDASSPLALYCAATFGVHRPELPSDFFEEDIAIADSATEFIELATKFVEEGHLSWLDVTGHGLNRQNFLWTEPLSPTVVLVGSKVHDLALFWNLRTDSDALHPAWIIPIPFESAAEPAVLEKLKAWLLAFLAFGRGFNYCLVSSCSIEENECRRFAAQFQAALADTPVEFVDYEPLRNRLPIVVPYEYEDVWPVTMSGRRLTIQPPRPRLPERVGAAGAWFVDLVRDMTTGRAVKDLNLPQSPVVFELLNGPCPPWGCEYSAVPRTGQGPDSINLRCSGKKEIVNIHLPSGEEILEEILREDGLEPLKDEKRSKYIPAIRRFGGLRPAAQAFTGKSGQILAALKNKPESVNKPKTVPEIKGASHLGDGTLAGESYLELNELLFQSETDRIKRVGRHRLARYARDKSPENLQLASMLEFWADRSVLARHWKIGPCSRCNQNSFVPQLDLQRRVVCPHCGNRITLPEYVSLGYSLNETVQLAVKEGIAPVVLTGLFLRNMTHNGFFWLPGVKYKIENQIGDIDLLACCDGHLVFCECKTLDDAPAGTTGWDKAVVQFLKTADIAMRCNADLAVLAARGSEYPPDIKSRITAEIGTGIPHLLLDKKDLETGYRKTQDRGHERSFGFEDIIPENFSERPREPTDKPRTMDVGWGTHTR